MIVCCSWQIVIGGRTSWLTRRLVRSARLLAIVADEIRGLVNRAAAEMHAHWPSSLTVEPRQRLGRNRQAKVSEECAASLRGSSRSSFAVPLPMSNSIRVTHSGDENSARSQPVNDAHRKRESIECVRLCHNPPHFQGAPCEKSCASNGLRKKYGAAKPSQLASRLRVTREMSARPISGNA